MKLPSGIDYARLFAALPAHLLVLLPDAPRFTIVTASDAYLAATGTRLDDVVGHGIFEVFPEDPLHPVSDGPALLRVSLMRVCATRNEDRMPMVRYDIVRPDCSEERYWTPMNSPVFDADGSLQFIVHRVEDATEFVLGARQRDAQRESLEQRLHGAEAEMLAHTRQLERSNRELAQREAELSAVFNQAPLFQGLMALDGTFLRGNELAFGPTGFSASEQLGIKCWDTGWWNGAEDTREFMRGAVLRAAQGHTTRAVTDYFVAGGERRRGDFSISPVRDASGRVVLVYATGRDCTEETRIQRALADSEYRYRSLVTNIAGMVYRVQAQPPWHFLYVSEGVERLTGYSPAYFVDGQRPWASVVLPEDSERVASELAEQAAAGRPFRVEYRIRHRDGSVRWVEGRVQAVEGAPEMFEGTVFDIDERKRAELDLAESREHFRYTVQTVPGALWTARPDGSLDFISDASSSLMGIAPAELAEHGWLAYLHPDDVAPSRAAWTRALQTGEPYEAQFRLRDPDGRYRNFQVRAQARRDADGRILRWYGMSSNIDDLMKVQARLQASEQRLRDTLQTAPGLSWTATPDGRVDFINDAARGAFGVEPEWVIDNGWHPLIHPDHLDRVVSVWAACVRDGSAYQVEAPMRSAQGGYRWISIRGVAQRDAEGQVQRWYGSAADIDDIKRAQDRAEQATRAKSAFLSTMSHEIRTPLNAVLGFAGLLGDTELGAQQRDFVSSIHASGNHLLGVINDILDYSKLESGNVALEFSACDLRATIESALDLVASQAARKNLELIYRIDDDVPPACRADPTRLRQVLVNLLGNAVKFTAAGEVMVTLESRPLGNDEHEFALAVRDTGIGIPAEQRDRLFRDFSQVDDSVTRRFGGTGLGLAISRRLVEAHGGVIDVDSTPGLGSVFTVRLPLKAADLPQRAPALSLEQVRGRRVLIVDDNQSNLDILTRQLRAWHLEPLAVSDPLRAEAVLTAALNRGETVDLAILDHQMPALDGLGLARALRQRSALPMILLSSLGTTLEQAHGARADMAAVLTKPVHRSTLLETIGLVLARAAPARAAAESAPDPAMPSLRLLLAEDNAVNRKVALLMLRKLGYASVDIALDGLQAVAAVAAQPYDVVLMDMQMPNLDGLDATRRIRAELPPARQPQIVAMTANALVEDREACLAAGMDDHVAKPIELSVLTRALLQAAGRRGIHLAPAPDKTPVRDDAMLRARRISDQVLAGGGEMGALMRAIDWAQTPLGPVYTWPQSLRTALSILLTQKHPIFLWWGEELVQFYNDAYRPILGANKHPRALGQLGRDCFREIWPQIEPMVKAALERGESSMVERGLLCLDRNGLMEEGYFTYGYSPIRDESGGIGGIFVACSENTVDVLGARRSALLLELDDALTDTRGQAWARVSRLLQTAINDLPFAVLYRLHAGKALLAGATGLDAGSTSAPLALPEIGDDPVWPVFEAHRRGEVLLHRCPPALPALPPWPEPPREALVLPLGTWGALVAGLSPRLIVDAAYRSFVRQVARRLADLERHPAD